MQSSETRTPSSAPTPERLGASSGVPARTRTNNIPTSPPTVSSPRRIFREASPVSHPPPPAVALASARDSSPAMQLYHHPYSLDSQKVRIALEEKGIDYTSYHVNPLTGKNMNVAFFRMNPSAKLPVFQNGAHVIFRAIDIIQYIDRLAVHLSGEIQPVNTEVLQWMQKVDGWNPKMFTLTHTPLKYRSFVSKFIRRVLIARMAEAPDLASMYHVKLRDAYETEDRLKDPETMRQSEEELSKLLDDVEAQLNKTKYLHGEFSPADSMFIPILARIALLDLHEEYISSRPRVLEYHTLVKQRPSYKVVIGKYFNGWKKYCISLGPRSSFVFEPCSENRWFSVLHTRYTLNQCVQ
ncbi:hypothetical protein ZWY2020_056544 [Hordeum vulgare]|nr:hypothetical protein ZWY2020_056544 [Hordeum vulgare]